MLGPCVQTALLGTQRSLVACHPSKATSLVQKPWLRAYPKTRLALQKRRAPWQEDRGHLTVPLLKESSPWMAKAASITAGCRMQCEPSWCCSSQNTRIGAWGKTKSAPATRGRRHLLQVLRYGRGSGWHESDDEHTLVTIGQRMLDRAQLQSMTTWYAGCCAILEKCQDKRQDCPLRIALGTGSRQHRPSVFSAVRGKGYLRQVMASGLAVFLTTWLGWIGAGRASMGR